jgi:hypothetical protein
MARTYNAIDADGHILEPLDLWDEYIDPAFRERRPRFVIDDNGKERLEVEGKLLGNPRGIGSLGSVGVRQGAVKPDTLKYAEGKKGGFDPHARIVDMDADGIDAAFLYPSLGLFAGAVEDPGLAAAMCRAYNRWLADYCKPYDLKAGIIHVRVVQAQPPRSTFSYQLIREGSDEPVAVLNLHSFKRSTLSVSDAGQPMLDIIVITAAVMRYHRQLS